MPIVKQEHTIERLIEIYQENLQRLQELAEKEPRIEKALRTVLNGQIIQTNSLRMAFGDGVECDCGDQPPCPMCFD